MPGPLLPEEGSSNEFLVADADGLRAVHFPVADKDFDYPVPEYDVRLDAVAGTDVVDIVITARTLVRDLLLQADRLGPDAVADRGLITLLPGEETRITVRDWAEPDMRAARDALFSVGGV